jgi:hypothetical protein
VILVAACGGGDDNGRTAGPLEFCFEESALSEVFTDMSEEVLDNVETSGKLADLHDEWGRVTGGRRTFSASDQPLATAASARTPSFDGRIESVSCTVELYADADGASRAFEGTGFNGVLLAGFSDTGTFGVLDDPEIGDASRQYLSVHAVVSASAVLFRSGSFLAHVHVVAPTSSFGAEKAGLVAEAERLALILADQIEE